MTIHTNYLLNGNCTPDTFFFTIIYLLDYQKHIKNFCISLGNQRQVFIVTKYFQVICRFFYVFFRIKCHKLTEKLMNFCCYTMLSNFFSYIKIIQIYTHKDLVSLMLLREWRRRRRMFR